MTTFAERLKFLRKREKLTQKQMAEKLGVKQGSYSNWENGNREPNLTTLSDIAFLLDTTLDFLLGYSDTDDYTIFEEEKLNNLDVDESGIIHAEKPNSIQQIREAR